MTTYQVSLEHMSHAEGEMQALSQKIQQMLNELNENVQKSFANWEGDVKTVYADKQLQWNTAAGDMQRTAKKAADGLNMIGSSYSDGERFGTNLWES